jgi:aspartokinase
MKIVKFGGKSLANGEGINTVLNIIEGKIKQEKNRYRGFSKRESN